MQPRRAGQNEQQPATESGERQPERPNPREEAVYREEIRTPVDAIIDAETERAFHEEQRQGEKSRKAIVSIHGRDVHEVDPDRDHGKVA